MRNTFKLSEKQTTVLFWAVVFVIIVLVRLNTAFCYL